MDLSLFSATGLWRAPALAGMEGVFPLPLSPALQSTADFWLYALDCTHFLEAHNTGSSNKSPKFLFIIYNVVCNAVCVAPHPPQCSSDSTQNQLCKSVCKSCSVCKVAGIQAEQLKSLLIKKETAR
jgi:hypothetical protein